MDRCRKIKNAPQRARKGAFVRIFRTSSLVALLLWCMKRPVPITPRYGNTSLIPGPDNFRNIRILFIRTSERTTRWGDVNFAVNLRLGMFRNSRQNAELFVGENLLEHVPWYSILYRNHSSFVHLLRRWYCPSCRLNTAVRISVPMRDTRLFYHDTSEQRLICAVTYSDCPSCPEVICFSLNTVLSGQNPQVVKRRILPVGLASRNTVPVVTKTYHLWDVMNTSNTRVWLLDVSGAHGSFPLLFPVSIDEEKRAIWSYERSVHASGCSPLEGWRGSVPVIHLAEQNVWITLAHQTVYGAKRNHAKDLGRQYKYKFLLFSILPNNQSKAGISCQCLSGGDDLYVQGLPAPFVFLLGMEYIGIKGMYHHFIVSGSIDDRAPYLSEIKLSVGKIKARIL